MKSFLYRVYSFFFANRASLYFNKLLFQLSLRGMGILNYSDYKISGEKNFLNKILPRYNPSLVFDVGANIGNYTKAVRAKNSCEIYSFEPNIPTAQQLLQNTNNLEKVKIFEFGFSDKSGKTEIYERDKEGCSSHATLYREVISDSYQSDMKHTTISLSTLDEFCEKERISKISLLKIDTEGNEYKILLGASNLLSKNAIDIIHFEFNVMNISSRVFFKDFFKILTNYNLYRLLPNSLLKISYHNPVEYEIFAFQNIIAIRKDIDKER